jgi:hypothetical protein
MEGVSMTLLKWSIRVALCLCIIGSLNCTSKKNPIVFDDFRVVERIPQLLTRVDASYPSLALQAGIEGISGIKFAIDANGSVISGEVERTSGSNAGFEEQCIESGKRCRWIPAYAGGIPAAHWSYLETVFICSWKDVDLGKTYPLGIPVASHLTASDSSIRICEVYDTPSSIETTEMVEYQGLQSPQTDSGSLWIKAVIDDAGEVRCAMIVQSSLRNTQLIEALIRAFCSYQFKPAYYQGTAVATEIELQIVFAPGP